MFKKKISTKKLREGDVLAEKAGDFSGKLWIGLTKNQVEELKKSKKTVTIKEGVCFVPSFFLGIAGTALWGNVLNLVLAGVAL